MKYTYEDLEATSKFPGHTIRPNTCASHLLKMDQTFETIEKRIRTFLQRGKISNFRVCYVPHVLTYSFEFKYEYNLQTRNIGSMILHLDQIEPELERITSTLYGVEYGS